PGDSTEEMRTVGLRDRQVRIRRMRAAEVRGREPLRPGGAAGENGGASDRLASQTQSCALVSQRLFCSVPSNCCVVLNFSHLPPWAAGLVRSSSARRSSSVIGLKLTARYSACSRTPSLSQPVMVTFTPGTLIV